MMERTENQSKWKEVGECIREREMIISDMKLKVE